tara:strand:- start:1 stop:177 length:177 start_codon:yes stop_codon:yes gene_type:complete
MFTLQGALMPTVKACCCSPKTVGYNNASPILALGIGDSIGFKLKVAQTTANWINSSRE